MPEPKLNKKPEVLPIDEENEVKCIAEIQKSETEKIRFTVNEYNDQTYFSVRQYWLNSQGKWIATKKGLTFTPEFTPSILEGMQFFVGEKKKFDDAAED